VLRGLRRGPAAGARPGRTGCPIVDPCAQAGSPSPSHYQGTETAVTKPRWASGYWRRGRGVALPRVTLPTVAVVAASASSGEMVLVGFPTCRLNRTLWLDCHGRPRGRSRPLLVAGPRHCSCCGFGSTPKRSLIRLRVTGRIITVLRPSIAGGAYPVVRRCLSTVPVASIHREWIRLREPSVARSSATQVAEARLAQ